MKEKLILFLMAVCLGICFEFCLRVQMRLEPVAISVLTTIGCIFLIFKKDSI